MKSLEELIDLGDPGIDLVREFLSTADVPCDELPPADAAGDALLKLQVTTRSPLGAVIYDTGGILIDGGWLRILGSGHERLPRSLLEWNEGRAAGYLLVADDAAGGFFAINGGALGGDKGSLYYWGPDCIEWEPLDIVYPQFLAWCTTDQLAGFYKELRWPTWRKDARVLASDRCYQFNPPLWSAEGSVKDSERTDIPVQEAFDLKADILGEFVDDDE